MEVTFADENSQFLFYNHRAEPEDMLAARAPEQVGDALTEGHPDEAQENMQRALDMFYAGEITEFQRHVESENEDEFKVITYQASMMRMVTTRESLNMLKIFNPSLIFI